MMMMMMVMMMMMAGTVMIHLSWVARTRHDT